MAPCFCSNCNSANWWKPRPGWVNLSRPQFPSVLSDDSCCVTLCSGSEDHWNRTGSELTAQALTASKGRASAQESHGHGLFSFSWLCRFLSMNWLEPVHNAFVRWEQEIWKVRLLFKLLTCRSWVFLEDFLDYKHVPQLCSSETQKVPLSYCAGFKNPVGP